MRRQDPEFEYGFDKATWGGGETLTPSFQALNRPHRCTAPLGLLLRTGWLENELCTVPFAKTSATWSFNINVRDGASQCPRSASRGRADQGRGRAPRSFSVDQAVASWCNRAFLGGQASLPSREPRCFYFKAAGWVDVAVPSVFVRRAATLLGRRACASPSPTPGGKCCLDPAVNSEELNHSLAVSEIIAISGLRVTMLLVTCFSILFLKDPDLSPKVSAYSSLM